MKKTNITRDDVAKLAGVAPSTVSNVINKKDNVSDALRKKVEKAIRQLNYTPNLIARSLMTKSSKHIGLIIDDITNPHFAEFAKGAQYAAKKNGYVLSVNLAGENADQVVQDYLTRHVDGIIFNAYIEGISPNVQARMKEGGISIVDCTSSILHGDVWLEIDYYGGMKKAYNHLRNLGHEQIAYISGQVPSDSDLRLKAFKWCHSHFGRDFDDVYVVFGKEPYFTNYERGYQYALELMERKLPITAFIVANDYMAIGALRALKNAGVKVPKDISVVSFDNTVYAKSSDPALTSVGSSVFAIGKKAVKYIIQQQVLSAEQKRIVKRFPVELIIRESTSSPMKDSCQT